MKVQARKRTMLAWLLFAATFGCLAAGLAVALALVRPLMSLWLRPAPRVRR